MEELINSLGLQNNDLTFIVGLASIIIITLILSLLTRTKGEEVQKKTHETEPIETPEAELDKSLSFETEIEEITSPEIQKYAEPEVSPLHPEPAEEQEEFAKIKEIETKQESFEETEHLIETPQQIQEPIQEIIEESEQIVEEDVKEENFFMRLRSGLSKTHTGLIGKLDSILKGKEISDDIWDEFEETLVTSDLGVATAMKLKEDIEKKIEKKSTSDTAEIKNILKTTILEILKNAQGKVDTSNKKPFVMMVAGVNGVGKTTTIGKLAYKFKEEGKKVMVAAADTFRAAAIDQLEIWANRVGSDFIKGQMGSDPSAVAFDAIKAAISRDIDVLIIDTAGRLHTRTNLMDELKKLRKIIGRELEGAPHETILVLDATTGQNAIQQAKLFDEAIELTGIALTKLDGTAKGGVIVSIADELNIPVKYIGIGESLKDLRDFNAEEFVEALFFSESETIH